MNPAYLEDASGFRGQAERLCVPTDEAAVSAVLREASEDGIPVTIAGAGTGLTGGRVAQGGWVLSTEKLRRLEIHSGYCRAGAGVTLADLHAAAAQAGQFFPPDPTETSASVGGIIACNASGSRSFRYGATRRWVMALRVVLANGELLEVRQGQPVTFPLTPVRPPSVAKHTAGYKLTPGLEWTDLFAGSEGTLGVITEAELQLLPQPACLLTGVAFLPDDAATVRAVDAWRGVAGLRMLEYFDGPSLEVLRDRYPEIPAGSGGALLFEQEVASSEAAEHETDLWVDRLTEASADVESSWFAASAADRERFRRFRHALPELVNDRVRRNGFTKLGSDYAVPAASNAEMLTCYRTRLEQAFPGRYVIFGHIGDAHLHVNILPDSEATFEGGRQLLVEFARRAVALGGTVSAEHGLGKRKKALLEIQYTPQEIDAMRRVKLHLDPQCLLGRGTLFDFG